MKKQIGIWLDYKEAYIIYLNANGTKMDIIPSGIEDFHFKGGSRSKVPYGPMEVRSEKTFLERRKHQIKSFYTTIMKAVEQAHEIFIMGAGEAKVGLRSKMLEDKNFKPVVCGFEVADTITDNQKIAKVIEFFGQKNLSDSQN